MQMRAAVTTPQATSKVKTVVPSGSMLPSQPLGKDYTKNNPAKRTRTRGVIGRIIALPGKSEVRQCSIRRESARPRNFAQDKGFRCPARRSHRSRLSRELREIPEFPETFRSRLRYASRARAKKELAARRQSG